MKNIFYKKINILILIISVFNIINFIDNIYCENLTLSIVTEIDCQDLESINAFKSSSYEEYKDIVAFKIS